MKARSDSLLVDRQPPERSCEGVLEIKTVLYTGSVFEYIRVGVYITQHKAKAG